MNISSVQFLSRPNYSKLEAWINAVVFYIFLHGVVCSVANIFIVVSIRRSKRKLRNRFFTVVSYLSACRLLISLNMGALGVKRILNELEILSFYQSKFICVLFNVWIFNGLTLELMLVLVLVLDRIAAIVFSMQYRNMTVAQAKRVCVFCYSLSLAKTFVAFASRDQSINLSDRIFCVNVFNCLSTRTGIAFRTLDMIVLSAIFIFYGFLTARVYCQIRNARVGAAAPILDRQLALLPALRHQVLLHGVLQLISKSLLFVSAMAGDHSERVALWGGVVTTLDTLTNTMALLLGNANIRTAFRQMLWDRQIYQDNGERTTSQFRNDMIRETLI